MSSDNGGFVRIGLIEQYCRNIIIYLFHLSLCMKGTALWLSLGMFLVSGIILLNGQSSEATDLSNFTVSANSTGGLIEEEKEEDEINASTPTDIKTEQLANTSR
jgi:hypothetical protein